MKNVTTILCLIAISLTVFAENMAPQAEFAVKKSVDAALIKRGERRLRIGDPKIYYTNAISKCTLDNLVLFTETYLVSNSFSSCTGILREAISNGDLSVSELKDIIDVAIENKKLSDSNAMKAEARKIARLREIDADVQELINYGNEKLK